MAWNKNEWTYTRNVYHGCEKIFKYNENDEEISFFGQLDDDFPNGLGAISCNGKFVCGGYWKNGELFDPYTEDEYNKAMNEIQNSR